MTNRMSDAELQAVIAEYEQAIADKAAGRPVPKEDLKAMRSAARKAQQSLEIREAAHRTVANMNFEWTDEKRDRVEAIIRAGTSNRRLNT